MSGKHNYKGQKNLKTSKAKKQAFSSEVTIPKLQLNDLLRRIIQLGSAITEVAAELLQIGAILDECWLTYKVAPLRTLISKERRQTNPTIIINSSKGLLLKSQILY